MIERTGSLTERRQTPESIGKSLELALFIVLNEFSLPSKPRATDLIGRQQCYAKLAIAAFGGRHELMHSRNLKTRRLSETCHL